MSRHWPTDLALEVLHGPDRCRLCGGREWVAVDDPLYPGTLVDVRCPACCATISRFRAADHELLWWVGPTWWTTPNSGPDR